MSTNHALKAEVRLFDKLFVDPNPSQSEAPLHTLINPSSLQVIHNVMIEPCLIEATLDDRFQFLRKGYFCLDTQSTPEYLIFNRIVSLKDSWAKVNTDKHAQL